MMYECYKKPYFQIYKSMFQIVSGSSLSSFPTSLLNIPFILSIWVLLPDLCFSSKRPWASDPLPLLCSTTSPLFYFLKNLDCQIWIFCRPPRDLQPLVAATCDNAGVVPNIMVDDIVEPDENETRKIMCLMFQMATKWTTHIWSSNTDTDPEESGRLIWTTSWEAYGCKQQIDINACKKFCAHALV